MHTDGLLILLSVDGAVLIAILMTLVQIQHRLSHIEKRLFSKSPTVRKNKVPTKKDSER